MSYVYRGNLGSKSPLKLIPFPMYSLSFFFLNQHTPILFSISCSLFIKYNEIGILWHSYPPKNITIEVYIFKYLKTLYLKLIFKHFILHNNKS